MEKKMKNLCIPSETGGLGFWTSGEGAIFGFLTRDRLN